MPSKRSAFCGVGAVALATTAALVRLEQGDADELAAVVSDREPDRSVASVHGADEVEDLSKGEELFIREEAVPKGAAPPGELEAVAKEFARLSDWFLLEEEEYLESHMLNPEGRTLSEAQRETLGQLILDANAGWDLLTLERGKAIRRIVEERHAIGLGDDELWPNIGLPHDVISSKTMSLGGRTYRFEIRKGDSPEVDAIFESEIAFTRKSNELIGLAILQMLDE